MKIINVVDYSEGIKKAAEYIHGKWGRKDNFNFYLDAIKNSSKTEKAIPRFYLAMENNEIIGCFAILINDLVSRQDLYPWFACLFVEKEHRGQSIGGKFLEYAENKSKECGYDFLYLTIDHHGYYEKYGYERIEDCYDIAGDPSRMYRKKL